MDLLTTRLYVHWLTHVVLVSMATLVWRCQHFCRPIEDIAGARRLSDSGSNKSSQGRMHLLGPPMEREWEYIDGSLCNVNINCYSGHCYRGKCARYTKKCPNECSGTLSNPQGTCKYYNEFDAEIETCAMYDLKCRRYVILG